MASVQPIRTSSQEPVALHDHAMDNLRFIRDVMERAGSFTAVPGWGGFAMGVTPLIATAIAALQPTHEAWLATWLIEGVLAIGLGAWAMKRKANSSQVTMMSAP